jgi:hypothetical protein
MCRRGDATASLQSPTTRLIRKHESSVPAVTLLCADRTPQPCEAVCVVLTVNSIHATVRSKGSVSGRDLRRLLAGRVVPPSAADAAWLRGGSATAPFTVIVEGWRLLVPAARVGSIVPQIPRRTIHRHQGSSGRTELRLPDSQWDGHSVPLMGSLCIAASAKGGQFIGLDLIRPRNEHSIATG